VAGFDPWRIGQHDLYGLIGALAREGIELKGTALTEASREL
jgi:hypothetical protein